AACGLLQLAGAASGGTDPLQPLSHLAARGSAGAAHAAPVFNPVRSVAELDNALRTSGRPVMLDFYADWCVSCKEMERFTFADAKVQARLKDVLLLQADVTANSAEDKALLARFKLFGPPGIIFWDKSGQEMAYHVIGYEPAEKFLRSIDKALP
ncbi:MAG: thioredoxin family protein, partial [Pseudomonadota bacterium]|nr:thioredoxin family protein [Pseudomonadota bacterium]